MNNKSSHDKVEQSKRNLIEHVKEQKNKPREP